MMMVCIEYYKARLVAQGLPKHKGLIMMKHSRP